MKIFLRKKLYLLLLSAVVAGCDSDDDDSSSNSSVLSGTISQLGSVSIFDADADNFLEMQAVFQEYPEPFAASLFEGGLNAATVSDDTCRTFVGQVEDFVPDELEAAADDATFISVGEVITLSGPSGSIGELQRASIGSSFIIYNGEVQTTEITSSGLTLDLPGDEFPAFSSVSVPDVTPFSLTSELTTVGPFDTGVSIDSTFEWEPALNEESRITLSTDTTFTSNLFDGERRAVISCILVDDGSFTLPADLQSQLIDFAFTELSFSIGREAIEVQQLGDAVLFVTRGSRIEL